MYCEVSASLVISHTKPVKTLWYDAIQLANLLCKACQNIVASCVTHVVLQVLVWVGTQMRHLVTNIPIFSTFAPQCRSNDNGGGAERTA